MQPRDPTILFGVASFGIGTSNGSSFANNEGFLNRRLKFQLCGFDALGFGLKLGWVSARATIVGLDRGLARAFGSQASRAADTLAQPGEGEPRLLGSSEPRRILTQRLLQLGFRGAGFGDRRLDL